MCRIEGYWSVTMNKSPIKALVGEDVTIPCYIDGHPTPLKLQKVAVIWTLKLPNTTEYTVYISEGSNHTASRHSSRMAESDLINGNASLYIPQVQISDDGEYSCSVTVTPYQRSAATILQVSVKPQVTLSSPEISVSSQCEKTVTCEVTKFYPESVKIRWERYSDSEGSSGQTLLDENTCLTEPVKNDDGTYNVTSVLPVRPLSLHENGDVYSCRVTHRSLENDLSLNVTLTVLRDEPSYIPVYLLDNKITIVTVFTFCFVFVLWTFIRKGSQRGAAKISQRGLGEDTQQDESPQLIIFTQCDNLVHNAKSAIYCDILKLCPRQTEVTVYMKRMNDPEKQLLCSWDSPLGIGYVRYDCCNDQRLTSSKKNPETYTSDNYRINVEMVPFLAEVFPDIYKCSFTVYLTPDREKENGAELIVEVTHPTQTTPISAKYPLAIN
ncbi:CD276 antigen-like isoform X2 [Hyperolius riggenbachi]|uniref:CD276 antigen-like isoform X2 n=1 Tax=Hyperolius riggenbachi TaxID=752182 RepID=UPI0035A34A5C